MKRFHINHGRDPSADCDFVRKDMHSEKMSGKDRREWGEYNDEFHGKAEVAGFIAFPLENLQKVSYDATCYSHSHTTHRGGCVCLVRWMTFKINYVSEKTDPLRVFFTFVLIRKTM